MTNEEMRMQAVDDAAFERRWRRVVDHVIPEGEVEWRLVGTVCTLGGRDVGVFRGTYDRAREVVGPPISLEWRPVAEDGARVPASAADDGWRQYFGFEALELGTAAPKAPEAPVSKLVVPLPTLTDCEALLAECSNLTGQITSWTAVMDGRGSTWGEVAPQDGRVARLWLGLFALRDRLRDVADRLDRL